MNLKIIKLPWSCLKPLSFGLLVGAVALSSVACQDTTAQIEEQPITAAPASVPQAAPQGIPQPAIPGPVTQAQLPQPKANGDFARSTHTTWEAVDQDPEGLNCRMTNATYDQIIDPGSKITLDIGNWPVVGTLKAGQDFEISLGPAGFGVVYDTQQQPWIYVEETKIEGAPSGCFVRANNRFVQPIPLNR